MPSSRLRANSRYGVAASALLALNIWIVWRLLWIDYLIHMQSVEGAFVSIVRYTREHWPHLGWWPLWYCGMPFANTYQPLLHTVAAAVSGVSGFNAARAYHIVFALAYALGPVTLFALAMRLTGRLGLSFVVGLVYSLCSPSAMLVPAIATDLGSVFAARRLHAAVVYGDSPNVAALTLLPLALLAIDRALRQPRVVRLLLAVLAVAAIVLTNIPASIAFGMAVAGYAIAYCARRADWLRLAGIGLCGGLLSLCIVPPSTLITLFSNTRWMEPADEWNAAHVLQVAILGVCVALLATALKRLGVARHIQFALLFLLISASVVLGNVWAGITLIAQPTRFHLAMEMALVCAVVFMAGEAVRSRIAASVAVVLVVVFTILQVGSYRRFARSVLIPINMEARSEFKVAAWLDRHAHGARVMTPGSVAIWLNAFTGTPQVTGCCDQGILLRPIRMAKYVIGSDDGAGDRAADISIVWLEALGARYVAVSGAASTEVYKDFAHPWKFEGRLKQVWREGDDAIYEVPQQTASLVHVVRRNELIQQVPENGVRIEPLLSYVAAIEDDRRPVPQVNWKSAEEASIRAEVVPDDVISIQIPWNAGWHATVNGHPRVIQRDALGFMFLDPGSSGEISVGLRYDTGYEPYLLVLPAVVVFLFLALHGGLQARAIDAGSSSTPAAEVETTQPNRAPPAPGRS